MARKKRKARTDSLSLRDIERLLEVRQAEFDSLQERREELAAELEDVEARIGALEGGGGGRRGRRKKKKVTRGKRGGRKGKKRKAGRKKVRGKKKGRWKKAGKKGGRKAGRRQRGGQNVEDAIEALLRKAGGPLTLGEIAQGVVDGGYKTRSQRFSVIVNQRLAKMPGVKRVKRGVYRWK